jgi:hypothetical protein
MALEPPNPDGLSPFWSASFGRLSEADVGRRWGGCAAAVALPSLPVAVSEHYVLTAGRDPDLGTGVDRREPVTPA